MNFGHHKPLTVGDAVIYYRASEKDKRGGAWTPTHKGLVIALETRGEKGVYVTVQDEEGGKVIVRLHQVAKMNLDGSDPGLPNSLYLNGETSKDEDGCHRWVHSTQRWDVRGHQCGYKQKPGTLYCTRHQPKEKS